MKARLTILISILILFVIGVTIWFSEATGPVAHTEQPLKEFTIPRGENLRIIASRLEQEGLIRSSMAFFILTRFGGFGEKIQAGNFRLSSSMDARTIAKLLTRGTSDVKVTIREGLRNEEIALELTKTLSIPSPEFLRIAREGYMFPDTYQFAKEATVGAVFAKMVETFTLRVTPEILSAAKARGLSANELMTLASIVEREGRTDEDRPVIAGILLRRLKADWPLQADATLQYALGYQPKEKTWWKKVLTSDDKEIDSPYNTYKNVGLPPGPISSPGLAAIKAASSPKETDYWYYLHDTKGEVHYAKTIEEHEANTRKYLQ